MEPESQPPEVQANTEDPRASGGAVDRADIAEDLTGAPDQYTLAAPLGYVPRKVADVLELDMEDGLILYNHDSSLVHHLNPSAAVIWHVCDGDATVGELAQDIADEYRLDVSTTRAQVATLVAEFDALGLVEDARSHRT